MILWLHSFQHWVMASAKLFRTEYAWSALMLPVELITDVKSIFSNIITIFHMPLPRFLPKFRREGTGFCFPVRKGSEWMYLTPKLFPKKAAGQDHAADLQKKIKAIQDRIAGRTLVYSHITDNSFGSKI